MLTFWERVQQIDWVIVIGVMLLTIFGLTAIFSLDRGQELYEYPFLSKQIFAFLVGLIALSVIQYFQYTFYRDISTYMYIASILLLIAVLFFGETIRGTRGWFVFGPVSLQPVEFAKFALMVHLGHYFSRHRDHFKTWWFLIGSAVLAGIPVVLTLLQPDAGSAFTMFVLWAVLVLVSGIRRVQFSVLMVLGLIVAMIGWSFLLQPYQKDRIASFLDPTGDPLGRGYNVTQSIVAVGSGQLFGRGLGFGSQSQLRFLPESRNDFIFAAISEELGLFGSTIILSLLAMVVFRILYKIRFVPDDYGLFVLIAFVTLVMVQVVVNVGMNIGLMPVTGIGLPFVSYGGSSLLAQYMMVGIVLTILAQSKDRAGYMIG